MAAAGLVPLVKLAQRAGLPELAQDRLTLPTNKGANAGLTVTWLVAGMAAGADSIDDWPCCSTAGWAGSSPTRTPVHEGGAPSSAETWTWTISIFAGQGHFSR